jgi:Galactose oxidase, central domain
MKSRLTFPLLVVLTIAGYGYGVHGSVPDVPTGQWMPGDSLQPPREGAVSVAVDDGRVLVIGGRTAAGPVATVEALNADGSVTVLAPMSAPRLGHTAVLLADGRVLVAGGTTVIATEQSTVEAPTSSTEIFTPGSDAWSASPPLNVARTGHTATALVDGRVMLAGGTGEQGSLDSTEVFEPDQGTFRVAGVLSAARSDAAATVAGESQVLIVGGRNADGVLATADLIDVDSGTVAQIALTSPRAGASVTRLLDGSVLVAGGNNGTDDLASVEVVDLIAGTSTNVASMSQPRSGHQATLLDDNANVLIVGGTNAGAVVTTTEHFIPWIEQFVAYGSRLRPAQPPCCPARAPRVSRRCWREGPAKER